ncbi:helix-turn-helix domain-containing protein [Clostridium sp.]|uniref:helix-turn-helix domain-containing protein n=1 Tax=Clostridium sp. TaxID=1506 RepID=UPI003D6D9EBF
MGLNEIIKVGNTIKKNRKLLNLTQEQMATKLNVPRSTYANYENNTREPSAETLDKIAAILGVNILNLIEDSNLLLYTSENGLGLERLLTFDEDLMKKIIKSMCIHDGLTGANLVDGDLTLLIFAVKNTIRSTLSVLATKNTNARNSVTEELNEKK